ncbi:MAG: hypothetical protein J6Q53_08105 [Oscillospiraceae bacterium]|nr:hypothetical protein [Oscillospiraceae bacterium]
MARKLDIQYIQYYTDGSAARQLEPKTPRKRKSAPPKVRRQKKQQVIYVDPLAMCGIVVSAVMLVLMIVGSVQLYTAQQQAVQMENYVYSLQEKNAVLTHTYETGYDLEQVKNSALALGMVPVEQVQTITIVVDQPEEEINQEVHLSYWERTCAFLEGLFA